MTESLGQRSSSVLGSLSFFLLISFSKYFFHLFNTVSKLTITLPFSFFITFTCCTSFPAVSLCPANMYDSFSPSLVSNLAYKLSYVRLFVIATAFFTLLFFFCTFFYSFYLLFCPTLSSRVSFLLCFPIPPHFTTMSSYLLFVSQMSLPV